MIVSLMLLSCPLMILALRSGLPTGRRIFVSECRATAMPRAWESQQRPVSKTDWPGCKPTKSKSTSKVNKMAKLSESKLQQYSEAEVKATITAMKKMQHFERQDDNPELETGHADDELGFVSPTFRSGFVSILGNANVGKSTLMNHLLGQDLSIVSPKPQTTRHRIFGILTKMPDNTSTIDTTRVDHSRADEPILSSADQQKVIPLYQYQKEGYQMIFADTPGMLSPTYKLQEVMQNTVRVAAKDGDVILLVTDVYGEPLIDEKVMKRLIVTDRPVVVAINKVDLAPKHNPDASGAALPVQETAPYVDEAESSDAGVSSYSTNAPHKKVKPVPQSFAAIQALWQSRLPNAVIMGISALHGTGVPLLLHQLLRHLSYGPLYYPKDSVADRDERFFATEIIRECVLKLYQEEIPYSCEVVMNSFEDKSDNFSVLHAGVIVARQSQKAIIIGTRGNKLAQLGTMARQKIEKFLGRKVYLDIQVKVDEEWRGKEKSLTKYGYIRK